MLVDNELIARAVDVNAALMALRSEAIDTPLGRFRRDRSAPGIYDANHVSHPAVSTPAEVDALLARMEQEYAGFGHRRVDVDFRTHPLLVSRLALEGYKRDDALVMLLEGELQGPPPADHDIRPITTDEQWRRLAGLMRKDWVEHERTVHKREPDMAVCEQMIALKRAQAPDVQYVLAYVDGEPAGYFSSWAGINGVGQVEDLFVLPEYRNRGIARALLHRCVRDCRKMGAREVVIAADPGDTPKNIYASLGWQPVAVVSFYLKQLKGQDRAPGAP
jgi:GNAT superfamily N-acetyltransferase